MPIEHETPGERQARLEFEAQQEFAVETRHTFQEALAEKESVDRDGNVGILARAMYNLGSRLHLLGFDAVTVDESTDVRSELGKKQGRRPKK